MTGLTGGVGVVAVEGPDGRALVATDRKETTLTARRIVGIDLGIASAHTVVVIDESIEVLARRRCRPTRDSLEIIEQAALRGAPEGTRLEVVLEPTGPAWLPVAVFFSRRGHVVHRVSSAKASALRRFLAQHAKANSIDAEALARLAIVDPAGLQRLRLAEGAQASLDRRVRAADRLTDTATRHKLRLRDLARQAMPMVGDAITGEMTMGDVAVLERYGDPRLMLRAGKARLTTLIGKASRGHHGQERAEAWLDVARSALDLYEQDPAVPFADLAAEMATEARLLRAVLAERDHHARDREEAYRHVDPAGLARTLPASPPSAAPCWWPPWATRPGSPTLPRSSGSPASPHEHQRPATPTGRAKPCARPDPAGFVTS